jgi:hypothetical protein
MLLALAALSALTDLARLLGLGARLLACLFARLGTRLLAWALADDGAVRVVVELELAVGLGLGRALGRL